MDEIFVNIEKRIGVLTKYPSGWSKELNLVSWNGLEAKYDIRDWSPDHTKMSRGITLHKEEVEALKNLLNEISTEV